MTARRSPFSSGVLFLLGVLVADGGMGGTSMKQAASRVRVEVTVTIFACWFHV